MLITKPDVTEYASSYASYIAQATDIDLMTALKDAQSKLAELVHSISDDKSDYRYAARKWSIKEVLIHVNDTERVFAYRALRFARNDKTELSGFYENDWVPQSNASSRTLEDILKEHTYVRCSTISLFESMTVEMSRQKGTANGKEISARALGFAIVGHALHHIQTIKERYLK